MLAITIFSSIVGDMLPITDTTPLIGEHRPLQPRHSYHNNPNIGNRWI